MPENDCTAARKTGGSVNGVGEAEVVRHKDERRQARGAIERAGQYC